MCQDLEHKILSVQNLSKIKMLELGIFLGFFNSNTKLKAYYKRQMIWQVLVYIIQLVLI